MRLAPALLLVALAGAGGPRAQEPVALTPARSAPDLDAHAARLLAPPTSVAEAVAAPARPAPLVDHDGGRQEHWARVRVRSVVGRDVRWVLPLSVDEATVVVVGGGAVRTLRTGRAVARADRTEPTLEPPVVSFTLPAGAERTLLVHVRHDASGYTAPVAPRPVPTEAFYASRAHAVGVGAAFLGLLFALAVYNLFLFATFRDRSYLAYVVFLVGSMVYWGTADGLLFGAGWPATVRPALELNFFGLAVAAAGYLQFARFFLRTDALAPTLDRVLSALTAAWALWAAGGAASLAGAGLWGPVQLGAAFTGLATLGATLAAGVRVCRRGDRPARYYLLASSAMVGTGALFIAAWLGWLSLPWSAPAMLRGGMAAEALLFAIALSARIRLLDRQRAEAEAAHREAEAANASLHEALTLKSNLLGFAAHDLRTPLVGILGFAELLQVEAGPPGRTYARHIEASAHRLLRLIQDLLVTASLDHDDGPRPTAPHDVGALVERAVRPLRHAAEAKGQRLRVTACPGCVARLDADRFHEVVDNLVSNAVKFSPLGGTVGVEVRGDARHVWLTVADSGPGFTDDDRERLFTPFAPLSARPTGGEPSTGLGLSIVKRIVDLHGGRLVVASEPGRGARVTVLLDAVADYPARPDGGGPAADAAVYQP